MRVLIYEFITGGGLLGAPLPPTLQREGAMMRDALLTDVMELPDVEALITLDPRCSAPVRHRALQIMEPQQGENGISLFQRAVAAVDNVWPIAPDSELTRLARIIRVGGKRAILSDEITLALCASKSATAQALEEAGMNVVPIFRRADDIRGRSGQWITKPDNGSGGDGMRLWPNSHAVLQACISESEAGWIFQPWCPGESLSLSMLCKDGDAQLLAVNRQHISWRDGLPNLDAISVNAVDRRDFQFPAQQIARAIPGLHGYIGVDLIRTENGELLVLEINPRLTTSYCGLRRALDVNVAAILLEHEQVDFSPSRNETVMLDLCSPTIRN